MASSLTSLASSFPPIDLRTDVSRHRRIAGRHCISARARWPGGRLRAERTRRCARAHRILDLTGDLVGEWSDDDLGAARGQSQHAARAELLERGLVEPRVVD